VIRDNITGKHGGLIVQYMYHELKTGNINKNLVANQRELEDKWMDGGYVLSWTES
jgi:hypothetical protein